MQEFWFPILLAIMLILAIGFFIKRERKWEFGTVFSGMLLIFLVIIWSAAYASSIGEIADMRDFIDATKSTYEYTIISTQEVEIKAGSSAESSFRDKIEWYNEMLEKYKQYNSFWLMQGFVANVPIDMVPIVLK